MDENRFQEDDLSLEEEFAPIELKVENMESNMGITNIPQGTKSLAMPDIMRYGVIGMSVFLILDMFLPYITIKGFEGTEFAVNETMILISGTFGWGFLAIGIVMLVALYLRKEKIMIVDGLAAIGLCFRAANRASLGRYATNASLAGSGLDLRVKYGFGFYGMIIGAIGLALFVLGYILSTDVGKAWKD